MNQKTERVYTTKKVDTFLNMDKKMYAGIFAGLLFYLGACMIALVDYILNGVDFVHITAVLLLFLMGLVPAWIFAEGYFLSRQAVKLEEDLSEVSKGVISWKMLSKICKRKNSIRLVSLMLQRGFIKGIRINMEHKVVILEELHKTEINRRHI